MDTASLTPLRKFSFVILDPVIHASDPENIRFPFGGSNLVRGKTNF